MRVPHAQHPPSPRTARAVVAVVAIPVVLMLVAVAAITPEAFADPDLDELERERDALEAEVEELARDEDAARDRLDELERDAGLAVEEYHVAQERLEELEGEVRAATDAVADARARVADREEEVADLVRALYKGESVAGHTAWLAATQPGDAARQLGYLTGAQRRQQAQLDALVAERDALDAEEARLREAEAAAREAAQAAEQAREEAERRVAAQADEVQQLNAALADTESEVASVAARITEERERREQEQREREEQAREEAAAGSGGAGGGDSAGSGSGQPTSSGGGASAPSGAAEAAVQAALSRMGTPYQWGATGPNAFDCSGLTQWAWAQAGVQIPRSSRAQYSGLPKVSRSELRAGDLVFFGSPIHHVGMYLGDGTMVEAPYSGMTVRTRSINRPDYAGAARPGG